MSTSVTTCLTTMTLDDVISLTDQSRDLEFLDDQNVDIGSD